MNSLIAPIPPEQRISTSSCRKKRAWLQASESSLIGSSYPRYGLNPPNLKEKETTIMDCAIVGCYHERTLSGSVLCEDHDYDKLRLGYFIPELHLDIDKYISMKNEELLS